MSADLLVQVTVVAVAVAQLCIVWFLYRRSAFSGSDPGVFDVEGTAAPTDSSVVLCETCGASNDVGYRFCRNCASELPGLGTDTDVAESADEHDYR